MALMDFKKWYAKVKYYNGDIEDISVRKIKTQEGNQFSPKNYKDFNSNTLYSVKTAMNDMEGKEQRYYAYISKLAGSIEDLNQNDKRISWPAWPSDVRDEPDNTSQDERQQYITSSSILAHREKAALKKSKKRTAAEEYQKFLYNYSVDKDLLDETSDFSEQILSNTAYSSECATKKCSQNQEELLINRNRTKTVSIALKELKNLLDEEIQKIEEKMENRSKMIEEKMENRSKMIEETIKEQLSQACENTTSKIEEILKKACISGDSTSGISSETENKIHLGSGFYCTPACFSAMKAAKNDSDWAIALLVGVFGEDAKLMRIYPRKQGLKKFPLGFLMLAQNLYRERVKDYEGDIDEMVRSLPAYLSDRALDLGGGRNMFSRANKSKNISQRVEKEATITDPSTISTTTSLTKKKTSLISQRSLKFKEKFKDAVPIQNNNNT